MTCPAAGNLPDGVMQEGQQNRLARCAPHENGWDGMEGSVKLISLLGPAHAASAWEEFVAARLSGGIAHLDRLVFNEVLPVDVRGGGDAPLPYVAIVEAWFAGRDGADAFAASVREHGAAVQLYVNPLLINDCGRRPLPNKIMVTLKRRADLTREQAQHHWRTRHVEVGLVEHNAADFLQLYFQNHVFDSDQPHGSALDFDGMPEFWVDPGDLAEVGADSPVMRAIAEDELLFVDRTAIVTMMVAERELFVAAGVQGGWPVCTSPLQDVLRAGQGSGPSGGRADARHFGRTHVSPRLAGMIRRSLID